MKRSSAEVFSNYDAATRTQEAALCWRRVEGKGKGKGTARIEVLLVTSRETGRWVVPKGWLVDGLGPGETAEREAWEEAGVQGRLGTDCIGVFTYEKVLDRAGDSERGVACAVAVYPLRVTAQARRFPEAGQRRLKWFAPDRAARKVAEAELRALLAGFEPEAPES